jgi:hypothetical protein
MLSLVVCAAISCLLFRLSQPVLCNKKQSGNLSEQCNTLAGIAIPCASVLCMTAVIFLVLASRQMGLQGGQMGGQMGYGGYGY